MKNKFMEIFEWFYENVFGMLVFACLVVMLIWVAGH